MDNTFQETWDLNRPPILSIWRKLNGQNQEESDVPYEDDTKKLNDPGKPQISN